MISSQNIFIGMFNHLVLFPVFPLGRGGGGGGGDKHCQRLPGKGNKTTLYPATSQLYHDFNVQTYEMPPQWKEDLD